MIVLNLLNQLFGRRGSISRSDIDTHQKSASEQQRIEENAAAHEFDNTALDGWSESGLKTESMKQLDQRMSKKYGKPKFSLSVGVILVTLIIGSTVLFYLSLAPAEQSTPHEFTPTIVLNQETERTEIDLIPAIESLTEISEESQVRPQELIAKNIAQTADQQASENNSDRFEDKDEQQQIIVLPIVETNTETSYKLVYNQAKEIYLKDLKLIDYRAYRDGEITTERLRYSGTPANQENWEQSNEEELVWEKVTIPYIEYIEKTMELIAKNKYKKALTRLELILENYPDDINANFYSGLSYYNLGNYDLSIARFEKSFNVQFGNFYEEARWFKSLALHNLNKTSEAKLLWQEISAENGFYSSEAIKKLKKN